MKTPKHASESVSEEAVSHKPVAKVVGIVLGAIALLVLLAYLVGVLMFQGRFVPGSSIDGDDVSLMSSKEVSQKISERAADYVLHVDGDGFSLQVPGSAAGVEVDAQTVVSSMLASVDAWRWPFEIAKERDLSDFVKASFDQAALEALLSEAIGKHNEQASLPVDATVAFDEKLGQFAIVPEQMGEQLDFDAVLLEVEAALRALDERLELTDEQCAKPSLIAGDDRLVQAAASANGMLLVNVAFQIESTTLVTLNAHVVKDWITFGEDCVPVLSDEALVVWARSIADACTTYQKERTYTRADGKVCTVSGGTYGWIADADAFVNLVRTAVETDQSGPVSIPVTRTGKGFSELGGRDWGNKYVDVDLSEQHTRLYDDNGELVWESDIVSGVPSYTGGSITPTGVYTFTANSVATKLVGTDWDGSKYESYVRNWMPFVGNLIGLHDADWQYAFGGTRYRDGYGSHGCVNLPVDKAYELSTLVGYGDVVVVHW